MTDTVTPEEYEDSQSGFQSFENIAVDHVQAVAYNSPGDRIAVASADHKLRVYNRNSAHEWTLFEQWRSHDAEILHASRPDPRVS